MKKMTPEILEKMKELREQGCSGQQIANVVGLHKNTVRINLALAGAPLPNQRKRFTKIGQKGVAYIKENIGKLTVQEMANHLQVHPTHLRVCMRHYGLLTTQMKKRTVWSSQKDMLLVKNYATMKMMDLEKLLGTFRKAIHDRARALGVTRDRHAIAINYPAKRAPRKVAAKPAKEPETPKRVRKMYSTNTNPTAGKVPVKLNYKTTIYLPANYTPEMLQAAKARYGIQSLNV